MDQRNLRIPRIDRRTFLGSALGFVAGSGVLAACTSLGPGSPAAQVAPVVVPKGPASAPAVTTPPLTYKPGEVPIAMLSAKDRTPAMWSEYLGVRLVETRDSSGPPAFTPKPGDLYFFTNESTTWGATNTRNNVVIIDAKTKRPIVQSNLPDEYSINRGSHGIAVSSDGRWIYLPAHGGPNNTFLLVIDGITLKLNRVYQSMGQPHHINNITMPDGRELLAVIDFGWNWAGSGIWVLDPSKENAIVGGMSRADFSGNPYIISDVVGKYMWVTVPAATSALREKMDGFLAKVNVETWKVEQAIPVGDPIWPAVGPDGKIGWITLGGHSKVAKVDLEKGRVIEEITTGPGPWGARLSIDGTKLYVADKGEASGYGQQGRTMTIIDTESNVVTNVVPIGITTDHIILSPDGKEVWATSNAQHLIVVVDTATEEPIATIKMPNDGDTHGSTFVQYKDDGGGKVVAEVVSSFSGLRGSALARQKELLKTPPPEPIRITPYSRSNKTPASFSPATVTVDPNSETRLLFINSGGTSGGTVAVESKDLNIPRADIKPGTRLPIVIKAPAQEGEYKVIDPSAPESRALTVVVKQGGKAAAQAAATANPAREIKVVTEHMDFVLKEMKLKAGERIKITLENRDDEKHNIVAGEIGLLTPDADIGKSMSYEWTVPNRPGTYTAICIYHPTMIMKIVIE